MIGGRKAPMERPIELAPEKVRELRAAGVRVGVLVLPMVPRPVLTEVQRRALFDDLEGLGYLARSLTDVEAIAHGFDEGVLPALRCPWGRGGDLLWVREPWAQVGRGFRLCGDRMVPPAMEDVLWRCARSMPREAARLVLKVEHVSICADKAGAPVWVIEVEVRR